MCLYTKMVLNPKYLPNKKNGGNPPECPDERVRYIPIGCGNCIECRRLRQREWRVRLQEEIKHDKTGKFVTLTFSEEALEKVQKEAESKNANIVAGKAIRLFTERWRKKYKKTIKHWLIAELGHENTERLHLHGILFTELDEEGIAERWQYGKVDTGYSMNEKCINYITKYVTKVDKDHKGFIGKIFTSKGIGKKYIGGWDSKIAKKNNEYRLPGGNKTSLPIYYKNKLFTEEEKEKLWIQRLEEDTLFVNKRKIKNISTEEGQKELKLAIEYARNESIKLGYGGGEKKKQYYAKKQIKNLEMSKEDIIFETSKELATKKIKHYEKNKKKSTKKDIPGKKTNQLIMETISKNKQQEELENIQKRNIIKPNINFYKN